MALYALVPLPGAERPREGRRGLFLIGGQWIEPAAAHLAILETTSHSPRGQRDDRAGNRTKVTDPEGKAAVTLYDSMNRVTKVMDSEDRSTVFLYDLLGNRIKLTGANGNATVFYYDSRAGMTKLQYADGQSIVYA